ncbi:MAG: hypothetical protein ACJ74Y_10940 [Bryobacteraceae bacterium]
MRDRDPAPVVLDNLIAKHDVPPMLAIFAAEPNCSTKLIYDKRELAHPAALALSPDQGTLIVTDAEARFSWSFQIGDTVRYGEPFLLRDALRDAAKAAVVTVRSGKKKALGG